MRVSKVTWYTPAENLPKPTVRLMVVLKESPDVTHFHATFSEGREIWWILGIRYRDQDVLVWAYMPEYDDAETEVDGDEDGG